MVDKGNLKAIDAIRGYAVLLVIICHAPAYAPDLVWPVKRLLLMGNYGVQLFFLASAVTLLMSWSKEKGNFSVKYRAFLFRRVLRIAPLYFLAILFYWLVDSHTTDEFSASKLISTLLFYNAWSPYLMPATATWMPVPGGWSISVEFIFYLIFPFCAAFATTLIRSALFFLLSTAVMILGFFVGTWIYPELDKYSQLKFLYFWPPNQFIIFAVGFILFFAIRNELKQNKSRHSAFSPALASGILLLSFLLFSYFPSEITQTIPRGLPPVHLLITMCMAFWSFVIICRPINAVINNPLVSLGKVSFSVYILHFAIMKWVVWAINTYWTGPKLGILSLPYVALMIIFTTILTYLCAKLTYRWIELPFIVLAKTLTTMPLEEEISGIQSVDRLPPDRVQTI